MSARQEEDTSPLEYWVTGGVILLFGLLYYLLNQPDSTNWPTGSTYLNTTKPAATLSDTGMTLGWPATEQVAEQTELLPTPPAQNGSHAREDAVADKPAQLAADATENPQLQAGLQQQLLTEIRQRKAAEAALQQAQTALQEAEHKAELLAEAAQHAETASLSQSLIQDPEEPQPSETVWQEQQKEDIPELAVAEPANAETAIYTLPDGRIVDIPAGGFAEAVEQAILEEQTDSPLIFDQVYFDSGSARLDPRSQTQIEATAALLNTYPEVRILLRGHSDATGAISENSLLSLTRSDTMKNALTALGIDADRINIEGVGPLMPVAPNDTEQNRRKNRRIELIILGE